MSHLTQTTKKIDAHKDANLMKTSTYLTVFGVSLIILIKTFGWFTTSSVTILASLIDSLLDICVSIMNLVAVHYSLMPADHQHRFGHQKIEDIAVFAQAVFFGASGIGIISESIQRFFTPSDHVVTSGKTAILIMIFSVLINLSIVGFQRYVIKRTKSQVIKADSVHYFADFLTNIVAIIGLFITMFWSIPVFDAITAIFIAIYIIISAMKLLKNSFNNLMDKELDDEVKQDIIKIIRSHKNVIDFHDLKTRYAGAKPFVQFHLVLDSNMTIKKAHKIIIELEEKILKKIPQAEIIVHQDPDGIDEEISYIDK